MSIDTAINPSREVAIEPFDYNPSAWSERRRIALIASIAFFIALYLGLYQWRPADPSQPWLVREVWDPVFGGQSMRVLNSNVSHTLQSWFGIPDAILGALAYLGDIIFSLAGSTRRWQYRPWLVLMFGVDVIPLGIVSAILVAMQGLVVGAWCGLCLFTAALSIVLAIHAFDEVWPSLLFLHRVWRRSRSVRVVCRTFCGIPSHTAAQVGDEMVRGV